MEGSIILLNTGMIRTRQWTLKTKWISCAVEPWSYVNKRCDQDYTGIYFGEAIRCFYNEAFCHLPCCQWVELKFTRFWIGFANFGHMRILLQLAHTGVMLCIGIWSTQTLNNTPLSESDEKMNIKSAAELLLPVHYLRYWHWQALEQRSWTLAQKSQREKQTTLQKLSLTCAREPWRLGGSRWTRRWTFVARSWQPVPQSKFRTHFHYKSG